MKILVAYYSFTGNNEVLARALQLKLDCDLYRITEMKERKAITILIDILFKRLPKVVKPTVALQQYDHVIFCAPIWNGKIATPLKSFLNNEKNNIQQYSFATICSGRSGQYGWLCDELRNTVQKKPLALTELMINDLLPQEKKDNIKYTTPYRIQEMDVALFGTKVDHFLNSIKSQEHVRH